MLSLPKIIFLFVISRGMELAVLAVSGAHSARPFRVHSSFHESEYACDSEQDKKKESAFNSHFYLKAIA